MGDVRAPPVADDLALRSKARVSMCDTSGDGESLLRTQLKHRTGMIMMFRGERWEEVQELGGRSGASERGVREVKARDCVAARRGVSRQLQDSLRSESVRGVLLRHGIARNGAGQWLGTRRGSGLRVA